MRLARRFPLRTCLAVLLVAGAAVPLWPAVRCAGATWTDQRQAGTFLCQADFPLDEVVGLLSSLASLQNDLHHHLGVLPSNQRIEVYLFRNQGNYRAFLRHHFPNVPERRALYVQRDGPGLVMTYRSREMATDLRHECTHALLHAALPMVPLWLDEGLAEYFEQPPNQRAHESVHLRSIRWNARLGMVPRITDLEKLGDMEEMGSKEYRDAWSWVHFMLHGPPSAKNELVLYLNDIAQLTPPGLLSQRLGRGIPDLNRQYLSHFRRWND